MANMKKLQTPIGLQEIGFVKFGATTEKTLGNSVLANLSIETNDLTVYGDDALQIDQSVFKQGTLSTETLLDDLQLEAELFGSTYTADGGSGGGTGKVVDKTSDISPYVAVYFIQHLMLRSEAGAMSDVYRYTLLPKASALRSSIKQEAQTQGESIEPKNHTVDFRIFANDTTGEWRQREDFATLDAAKTAVIAAAKTAAGGSE